MTEATVNGVHGETYFDGTHDTGAALVDPKRRSKRRSTGSSTPAEAASPSPPLTRSTQRIVALFRVEPGQRVVAGQPDRDRPGAVRPGGARNVPLPSAHHAAERHRASRGSWRRPSVKAICGFTGTGTGGMGALQPGIAESNTDIGTGGLPTCGLRT